MAVRRAASLASHCVGCQHHVLSAFITSLGPAQDFHLLKRVNLPPRPLRRAFSSHPYRSQEQSQIKDQESQLNDDLKDLPPGLEEEGKARQDDSAPWYLQLEDAELDAPNPFSARQQLPHLPPNPPPILEPLLKHVSIDLGLDYISVIDLRLLDPPPALGAGTIMIFGSVRSFRHLNVSADRLCRWLRTQYNLTPNADGLLGRNELKLKLRRRARRSKMLGAAGAIDTNDKDDGITTGWICVNVGEVEDGPDKTPDELRTQQKGFVGFGTESHSARIFVQMMTEAKRSETDLEGMWQALLEREGRKKEGELRAWEKLAREEAEQKAERNGMAESGNSGLKHGQQNIASVVTTFPQQQVRGYRTLAGQHSADRARNNLRTQYGKSGTRACNDRDENKNASGTSSTEMKTQLRQLRKLDDNAARLHLGSSERDRTSTTFLETFYCSFPPFPQLDHFLCLVELQCTALKLGHPGYTRLRLIEIFRDIQASSIWIPEPLFIDALEAVLLSSHQHETFEGQESPELQRLNAFRCSLGFAFELIERMEAHGYDVRTNDLLLLMLDAISRPTVVASSAVTELSPVDTTSGFLDKWNVAKYQHKFRRVLEVLYNRVAQYDDPIFLKLMETCIRMGQWNGFWDTWQHIARIAKSRGPKMYALMFSGLAKTGNESKCQNALLTCVPEMRNEHPAVKMEGEVARAVLECLVAARVSEGDAQWRGIVERCKAGLGVH